MKRIPLYSTGLGVCLLLVAGLVAGPTVARAADGYLGVQLQDVDEAMAAALGLDSATGVLVREVEDGSPAAEAGLQRGDLILSVDGREANGTGRFIRAIRRLDAGDVAKLQLRRQGRTMDVEVTLAEVPADERLGRLPGRVRSENGDRMWFSDDDVATAPRIFVRRLDDTARLGVNTHGIDPDLGRYFGASDGALVLGVEDDSPAAEAGLRAGDVIVGIDDEPVDDPVGLQEIVAAHEPGDEVAVKILRDKKEQTVDVELGEDQGLRLVRGLRGPHHAPRAPQWVPEPPPAPGLEAELEELRARLDQLEQQLERMEH